MRAPTGGPVGPRMDALDVSRMPTIAGLNSATITAMNQSQSANFICRPIREYSGASAEESEADIECFRLKASSFKLKIS